MKDSQGNKLKIGDILSSTHPYSSQLWIVVRHTTDNTVRVATMGSSSVTGNYTFKRYKKHILGIYEKGICDCADGVETFQEGLRELYEKRSQRIKEHRSFATYFRGTADSTSIGSRFLVKT